MGFFDSLGKAFVEVAKENKAISDVASTLSEMELIELYRKGKKKGKWMETANARKYLKEKYGYSDDDFQYL